MKDRYGAGMSKEEREAFEAWYRVCATHFHCRVIGQCYKLVVAMGRDDLMRFVPRIEGYIRGALSHPVLEPLKKWCEAEGVDLTQTPVLDAGTLKPLIRDDAY